MAAETDSQGKTLSVDEAVELDCLVKTLPEQYEILSPARQGGMGAVYKARNRYTGANLAVKVLRQDSGADSPPQQRFILEAKAASSLNHPNICRVLDFGMSGGMPYLVMEWIDGLSLQQMVEAEGPLGAAAALPLFQQIASALEHAHAHNVVHRDLKPDNVMLTTDGASQSSQVHIVDFGLAKLLPEGKSYLENENITRSGIIVGSPLYMSPEQARGMAVDGRADIYSLGCLMYMTLNGAPPFRGATPVDTITKHMHEQPRPFDTKPNVPAALQNVVLKAMEKEARDRYQTMSLLKADLSKLASGEPVPHFTLSAQRRRLHSRVLNVVYFVGAFLAVYLISMSLQAFLDASHKGNKPAAKPSAAASHRHTAPESESLRSGRQHSTHDIHN